MEDHSNFWPAFTGISIAIIIISIAWVLPIVLGIKQARKKNYSPLWMLFGIHPIGAWVTFIIFACLKPRIQCESCGGFVAHHFKICPYCKKSVGPAETQTLKSDRFRTESKYF